MEGSLIPTQFLHSSGLRSGRSVFERRASAGVAAPLILRANLPPPAGRQDEWEGALGERGAGGAAQESRVVRAQHFRRRTKRGEPPQDSAQQGRAAIAGCCAPTGTRAGGGGEGGGREQRGEYRHLNLRMAGRIGA